MNGRMYDAKLGRFLSPDNYIQEPFSTQSFNRYGYVWNNPLKYTDQSGEFIFTALVGALISVVTNGIINSIDGRHFFQGAGVAAITGAIGGVFAKAIGIATQGLGAQALAHGHLGGMMSGAMGGDYFSGFAAGAVGSIAASGAHAAFKSASNFWKAAGIITAGSLSGGAGSVIAGGKFWDGFRNGAISSSLNHVVHMIKQKNHSIKSKSGKELNPDNMFIENKQLKAEIIKLYEALELKLGAGKFEFKVTGGERYNSKGVNYSSSDNKKITAGKPSAHNVEKGARAVDLRIRYISGENVHYSTVNTAIISYGGSLFYQWNRLPTFYADGHHHLQLPNVKKYWK